MVCAGRAADRGVRVQNYFQRLATDPNKGAECQARFICPTDLSTNNGELLLGNQYVNLSKKRWNVPAYQKIFELHQFPEIKKKKTQFNS